MKKYMSLLMIPVMSFLFIGLSSCSKKDKKQSIGSGRGARGASELVNRGAVDANGNPIELSPLDGNRWGEITGSPEDSFRQAIKYLVSSSIDPQELGYVSGQSNRDTGVRFWGKVSTEQSFKTGPARQNILKANSQLRIVIWDSFAGQTDSTGQLIPEYPIHIVGTAEGFVDGNRAVITFTDAYGSIKLEGTLGNNFQGTISFVNTQYWDGASPGASGTIGQFNVPTCGFFNCN